MAGDAIPVRSLDHGLAERHGRGGVHVVPGRVTKAAGIGGSDGGENVYGVSEVETVQHAGQRRAQRDILNLHGRGQRRAQ